LKKIIAIVSALFVTLSLCSCGGGGGLQSAVPTATPIPEAVPTEVLKLSDVQAAVGSELTYVQEGGVEKDGNVSTAVYRTEPLGKGDLVRVEIRQLTSQVTREQVRAEYDEMKSKRPSAQNVEGLGDDAYIAYPSIHVYKDGYHLEITAGSGADEAQAALLKNLAQTAMRSLEATLMPAATAKAK
jgi:hypothetical protein